MPTPNINKNNKSVQRITKVTEQTRASQKQWPHTEASEVSKGKSWEMALWTGWGQTEQLPGKAESPRGGQSLRKCSRAGLQARRGWEVERCSLGENLEAQIQGDIFKCPEKVEIASKLCFSTGFIHTPFQYMEKHLYPYLVLFKIREKTKYLTHL